MPFTRILTACLVCIAPGLALSQELIIYPNQNQDQARQDRDQYDCYNWAKGQSNFDPMAPPTATQPPPQQQPKRGGLVRGAARGAIIGGIVDGSDGAKTGAKAGGAIGGIRRADQNQQEAQAQQDWEQQQAAQYQQRRNSYNRAYGACLEGRGYTVR